jgi:hypothetical protein
MVGTIVPIVYGERSRGGAGIAHWFHFGGAVIGAVAAGTVFGLVGSIMRLVAQPGVAVVLAGVGAVALIYSLRELGLADVPMPQFHRQVPTSWRYRYRPNVAAVLYGVGLGVGVATFVRVATLYVVLTWIVLVGDPVLGGLALSAFGALRGLPIVWFGQRLNSLEEGFAVTTLLNRWELVVHLANGFLLSWAGASFIATAAQTMR